MRKLLLLMLILLLALPAITHALLTDNDLKLEYYWAPPAIGIAHHYEVQTSTDNGVSWTNVGNTPNSSAPTFDNPFPITGIAGKTYLVKVFAVDANNNKASATSDPVMCTPGDANRDGQVELTDFTLVSRHWLRSYGDPSYNLSADLNDDGVVNIDDLTLVTLYWGRVYYNGAPDRQNTIFVPNQPQLGQNFPNPSNPETWIPYQISREAQVTIEIYNVNGQIVRILNLGFKPAGYYVTLNNAAYWDGKNEAGEETLSGVYFYVISAGDFHAARKMIVLK